MTIENEIMDTVQWLREQVGEAGARGLVVGLSGGIDSSVVAFLIKRAFPENALGVIMPIHSDPRDAREALALVEACDIPYRVVDLSGVHLEVKNLVMKDLGSGVNERNADANLRARLRMSALYTYANALNYLVVGTDNAAELYTGYFTKYGDGGVDLLPIANLGKGEVYEWGRYFGVPESILQRDPTAGLWEGQTDEKEMGVTYLDIDRYLKGQSIDEKSQAVIEKLHRVSAHKRTMPPIPQRHIK
ncbi:MAG: NAD(+) synthetase [delta proteobacterium ML8_F1]|nr:MAG: NAD(+) synthetase [delta proteobacterium ML8_F1]